MLSCCIAKSGEKEKETRCYFMYFSQVSQGCFLHKSPEFLKTASSQLCSETQHLRQSRLINWHIFPLPEEFLNVISGLS